MYVNASNTWIDAPVPSRASFRRCRADMTIFGEQLRSLRLSATKVKEFHTATHPEGLWLAHCSFLVNVCCSAVDRELSKTLEAVREQETSARRLIRAATMGVSPTNRLWAW